MLPRRRSRRLSRRRRSRGRVLPIPPDPFGSRSLPRPSEAFRLLPTPSDSFRFLPNPFDSFRFLVQETLAAEEKAAAKAAAMTEAQVSAREEPPTFHGLPHGPSMTFD